LAEIQILSKNGDFDEILRDSIPEGMKIVLGENGTQAILYHIDIEEVESPEKFHDRLFEVFGVGTLPLERIIVGQLRQNVGLKPASSKDMDFSKQVELARRSFSASAGPKRSQGA
jgi:hypothetical protein